MQRVRRERLRTVRPPMLYRLVINPLRAWLERDDRLLIEHWKDAMKPETRPKVRYINLIVSRDTRARRIA